MDDLDKAVVHYGATFAILTPRVAQALNAETLKFLQCIELCGEVASELVLEELTNRTQVQVGYGPAECTVSVTAKGDKCGARDIGRGVGAVTWVVEDESGARLAAVGAVGELWVEGPLVGLGYLHDPAKTAAAFVQDPPWLLQGGPGQPGRSGRLYRTGDLVRYRSDGGLEYVGRRDAQVKIRGQRVELSDVEHHVRRALVYGADQTEEAQVVAEVVTPPDTERAVLVAFVVPVGATGMTEEERAATVARMTSGLDERLAAVVPAYMVPAAYVPLAEVPMTATGKTDRRRLRDSGAEVGRHIAAAAAQDVVAPKSALERTLRDVWAQVLHMPAAAISVEVAFVRLGGDSITAMQVASRCRAHGVRVSVVDLLRLQTIRRLVSEGGVAALPAVGGAANAADDEIVDDGSAWALSPIQKMFFELHPAGESHYNQSMALQMRKPVVATQLEAAVAVVVERHAMLRARFSRADDGSWMQRVEPHSLAAFAYARHAVRDLVEAEPIAQRRQRALDIQQGPVFAVDLFEVGEQQQVLVLSAHHLVVDLVSWRVIWHDVQQSLSGRLGPPPATSFRRWCELQRASCRGSRPADLLPFTVQPSQSAYWGLPPGENRAREREHIPLQLTPEDTALLLAKSNEAFGTDPSDILLAALVHSFRHVFPDREAPAVFLEGHGREPIDGLDLDISETVGWFTTLCPLQLPRSGTDDICDAVRVAKDLRRRVPGKGRPYFASRHHSDLCRDETGHGADIELKMNYTGLFQQLEGEGEGSALARLDRAGPAIRLQERTDDAQVMGLVEVNAHVARGRMAIDFSVGSRMNHQERLRQWADLFLASLVDAVRRLADQTPRRTLADFPLLRTTYASLDELVLRQLAGIGVVSEEVRDIYPCTPLQEGILLSKASRPTSYANYSIWTCTIAEGPSSAAMAASSSRLADAWRATLSRHSIFSTVFVEDPHSGKFVQVVLWSSPPRVELLHSTTSSAAEALATRPPPSFAAREPECAVTICEGSDGGVACRLDISHALYDAASVPTLVRDLARSYSGRELPPAPQFREVVRCIELRPSEDRLQYWTGLLRDVRPCHFPTEPRVEDVGHARLPVAAAHTAAIYGFCRDMGITRATFLQVAWALVLSQYVGTSQVCFGYLASGRDLPIDGIDDICGPLLSMLVSRVDLDQDWDDVFAATSRQTIEHLSNQHTSLAEIQHALGMGGTSLFNTSITVRDAHKKEHPTQGLQLGRVGNRDAHEVDIILTAVLDGEATQVGIAYRRGPVSDRTAMEVRDTLVSTLQYILAW